MRRYATTLSASLAGLLALAPSALGAPAPPDAVPGEAIVKFSDGPRAERAEALRESGARVDRWLPPGDTALVRMMGSERAALARLARDPRVEWAEPNFRVHALAAPNDALFPQQWALQNTGQDVGGVVGTAGADIDVTTAWNTTVGARHVTVAVVDGGADFAHPDLAPNLTLTNPGETGGGRKSNGVDDDRNGLVDDWRGWDWVGRDNRPQDENLSSHGSRVTGIIAARGNDGAGVAGTLWNARVMSLRVLDGQGSGSVADVAAAFSYAGRLGIRIVNASLGAEGLASTALSEAIARYPDTLFVFAAGNAGTDNDGQTHIYPCDYPHPNVLCVAASDQDDALADFSNFGAVSVDVAAPGTSIASSTRGGGFNADSGTSYAAPFAAGVAGLVLAANPGARTAQLRGAVLAGAEPVAGLAGRVATGGRLSAAGALGAVPGSGTAPIAATGGVASLASATAVVKGTVVPTGGPTTFHFEYGPTTAYGKRTVELSAGVDGRLAARAALRRLAPGRTYHYRMVASDVDGRAVGADRVLTTPPRPPRRITVRPRVRGRLASIELGLPRASRARVLLERRTVVWRNGRRAAALTRVGALTARRYAAGYHSRALGRRAVGRYRATVYVASGGTTRRVVRNFRVSPPRPRITGIAVTDGRRRVMLTLFSRARVAAHLERLRGGRFVRVRGLGVRTRARGRHLLALPRAMAPGRYRVIVRTNEGGRRTERSRGLRI